MNKVKLARSIQILWNPVTDGGRVKLDFFDFMLDENGKVTGFLDPEGVQVHQENLEDVVLKVIDTSDVVDPVTGQQLPENMSGAGIMKAIKKLVDLIILNGYREDIANQLVLNLQVNNKDVMFDFSNSNFTEEEPFVGGKMYFGDGEEADVSQLTFSHTYPRDNEIYNAVIRFDTPTYKAIEVPIEVYVPEIIE